MTAQDFYFAFCEEANLWFIVEKAFWDAHHHVPDELNPAVPALMPAGFNKESSCGFAFQGRRKAARQALAAAGFTEAQF